MRHEKLGMAILLATAALVGGAVFGQAGSGRAAGNAPVGTGAPTFSGAAQEGQQLTTTSGSWNESPTTFAYAWSQCDASGGSCSAISGAAAATYTAASGDVGHTIRGTVTATNADGSTKATSAPSAVVSSATAPTNTTAPSISGTPQGGTTLTASQGSWSGSPTGFAFAWSRCDTNGNGCAKIDGATTNTYTVGDGDAGSTLRVSVTATNADGSTTYASTQTAAVPAANGCPDRTGPIQVADLQSPA
jgi:hypothetical protein